MDKRIVFQAIALFLAIATVGALHMLVFGSQWIAWWLGLVGLCSGIAAVSAMNGIAQDKWLKR
jgi:hypothetical protein